MADFLSYTGTVTSLENFGVNTASDFGCTQIMTVNGNGSVIRFILAPDTYFVDHAMVQPGKRVIVFYDASQPAPLIYPPQLRAAVVAVDSPYRSVKVSYFNNRLVSADNSLVLTPGRNTLITLQNDQQYIGNPGGHNLIVVYTSSTRSIPARTTPEQIVVLC